MSSITYSIFGVPHKDTKGQNKAEQQLPSRSKNHGGGGPTLSLGLPAIVHIVGERQVLQLAGVGLGVPGPVVPLRESGEGEGQALCVGEDQDEGEGCEAHQACWRHTRHHASTHC